MFNPEIFKGDDIETFITDSGKAIVCDENGCFGLIDLILTTEGVIDHMTRYATPEAVQKAIEPPVVMGGHPWWN